ncbi:hypothetical protein I3215_07185 [Streptomyces sp. RB110-1]|uniref:hypothetical protein n=1 Tax=unclassified Streptomyces TaxID=2593676 RepID=UPI001900D771|nr:MULTISPECIES: hypothetical protein [unclassified Streptomyces]MBK0372614.1 hypothetical protein [Streptomyces sp. RB110-1]MBK0372680.1 hypothetical protein [Streptomyces sp. RB110-1]MBK0384670.1 hypothetical protein [Streptomyces sp. RB110-2]MBK0390952.1 hypothetical protein [Streptomyces sp. RB110-2]
MNSYSEDLAGVERELREAELERDRLGAHIEGLKAKRDAFKKLSAAVSEPGPAVQDLTKADAIVKILRASPQPMSLGDIADALTAAGKQATRNGVSVYIDGLLKAGRVVRVARNQYRDA